MCFSILKMVLYSKNTSSTSQKILDDFGHFIGSETDPGFGGVKSDDFRVQKPLKNRGGKKGGKMCQKVTILGS